MALQLTIHTADVAQRESALVVAADVAAGRQRTILIDGGLLGCAESVHNFIDPILRSYGYPLDHSLVSHYDKDHSGAVMGVLHADNMRVISEAISNAVANAAGGTGHAAQYEMKVTDNSGSVAVDSLLPIAGAPTFDSSLASTGEIIIRLDWSDLDGAIAATSTSSVADAVANFVLTAPDTLFLQNPIHLIGHSLGGVIARSVAGQRPKDIASVITLASPIRGTIANRAIVHAAEAVRLRILQEHGEGVLPDCYTGACTCRFVDHARREVPDSMIQTAIYTKHDGIVDWRYCTTKKEGDDFEVAGTHIGMAFNATAYSIVAERLALAHSKE